MFINIMKCSEIAVFLYVGMIIIRIKLKPYFKNNVQIENRILQD